MKIALFSDTYPPRINGVATSVSVLRSNLVQMGHEVVVVTAADPDATQEFNVIRIPSIPFQTERLATVPPPWNMMEFALFNPDVIHTHSEFSVGITGLFAATMLRKPHVHTMHTAWEFYTRHLINIDLLEPALNEAARKYTALICNQADRVIVPTGKIENLIDSYGVHREIRVIPTGIELERFASDKCTDEQLREIREELGIRDNEKVLINIGRIEKEKNIDDLLHGLREYLLSHTDVILVFIGDGTAKDELEQLAAELDIAEQVIFAGKRPPKEINRYYRIGDVFVAASISETQGLTYAEAMASGVPVVAKRDGCLEHLLHEGENGFMFDDADGLVGAVDELLSDNDKRRRFSSSALEAANKLSSKTYAESVLALYEELVK